MLIAGGFLFAKGFKSPINKPAHVPAVDELVWGFAGGVVAAGQYAGFEVEAMLAEGVDDLQGILAREG